jgi:hypothetical protein
MALWPISARSGEATTHTGEFGVSTTQDGVSSDVYRIYRGVNESMILTIAASDCGGSSAGPWQLEILVNGASIVDGAIPRMASRTYKLSGVEYLDLALNHEYARCAGTYTISVLL